MPRAPRSKAHALPAPLAPAPARARRPGGRGAERGADRDRRPDAGVDAGDGAHAGAARRSGHDVRQRVRVAVAVLPVAGVAADRALRAQPRRARHLAAVGRLRGLDGSETLAVWPERAGYATVLLGKYLNRYGAATRPRCRRAGPSGTGSSTPRPTATTATCSTTTACCTASARGRLPDRRDHRPRRGDRRARAASPQPFFLWVSYLAPHNGLPREPATRRGPLAVPAPRHAGRFGDEPLPRTRVRRGGRARQAGRDAAAAAARRGDVAAIEHHYRQELGRCWRSTRASGGSSPRSSAPASSRTPAGLHLRQRLPARRAPRAGRQGARLRAVDPRAAADARPGVPAGCGCPSSPPTSTWRRRSSRRPAPSPPWEADGVSLFGFLRDPGLETGRDLLIEGPPAPRGLPRFRGHPLGGSPAARARHGRPRVYDLRRPAPAGQPRRAARGRPGWRRRWRGGSSVRACAGASAARPDLR